MNRRKIWSTLFGAITGLVVALVIVALTASVIKSDRDDRNEQKRERQEQHEAGIANCKAQHGTIQLDRLGWYIGCLVPTPKG